MRQFKLAGLFVGVLVALLIFSACGRLGRAPEDLDITPSPTITPSPSPTPIPDAEAADEAPPVDELQALYDTVLNAMPNSMNTGAITWVRRDDTVDEPPRLDDGIGFRIYFTEQLGGGSNLTFGFFESPEAALEYYTRRAETDIFRTGTSNDLFPAPNRFGRQFSTFRGIFVLDESNFLEVSIDAFSSNVQSPEVSLARAVIEVYDRAIENMSAVDSKPQRIEALIAALADEVTTGEAIWVRRASRPPVMIEDIENALGFSVLYEYRDAEAGYTGDLTLSYLVFDTEAQMLNHYNSERASRRTQAIPLDLSRGAGIAGAPAESLMIENSLNAASAILQAEDIYLIDINLSSNSAQSFIADFAPHALSMLEESLALYAQNGGE